MDRPMGSGRFPDLPSNNQPAGGERSPDLPSKKRKYNEGYHFITMVTNKRVEIFKYKDIAKAAVNTLLFYEERGDFKLKGFIVMPDHIHMICESLGNNRSPDLPSNNQPAGSGRSPDLPDIIRDIKKYIAKKAIEYLLVWDKETLFKIQLPIPKKKGHTYQLWQPDYYDFNILSEKKLTEKLRYMYQNPLRKGLCNDIFQYEFSDIKRYFGSGDPKLPCEG